MGGLAALRAEGKICHLGLSEASVSQLAAAHAICPVVAVQSELSLWSRDALAEVLPWCERNRVGFVAFAPLGRGFLANRFGPGDEPHPDDFRARVPRFRADRLAQNVAIRDGVRRVADRHGATTAQVALGWVLARGRQVAAVPGSTNIQHVLDNLAAADLLLSPDDLAVLDGLPAAVGSRY